MFLLKYFTPKIFFVVKKLCRNKYHRQYSCVEGHVPFILQIIQRDDKLKTLTMGLTKGFDLLSPSANHKLYRLQH
jgi:hypothetical protein